MAELATQWINGMSKRAKLGGLAGSKPNVTLSQMVKGEPTDDLKNIVN